MKLKSYSKINLTLRVLKKFNNGMHDIETNTAIINLFDEINIKRSNKDIIIFKGRFKNNINSKKNSVINTLRLFRKLKILKNFYKITIKKNIPVYAGLGGGTSNSASLAKYLFRNILSENLICALEKKLDQILDFF